jgi:hypothetical protein
MLRMKVLLEGYNGVGLWLSLYENTGVKIEWTSLYKKLYCHDDE